MTEKPSRNPFVTAASVILFGDGEWAHEDFMSNQLDTKLCHPTERRFVSVNELAAELESVFNAE